MGAKKTTRTKRTTRRTTKRAARPAAHDRGRDFTARLVERLLAAGVPLVGALAGEEAGERALARFELDDGKKMLRALAASLRGEGKMFGPLLLGSVRVRRELDLSWIRAREGSPEDKELMVEIGEAFVAMKEHCDDANLRTRVDLYGGRPKSCESGVSVPGWLQDLNRLLPQDEAEARRYKDAVFLDATIQEMSRDGERPGDVNALTSLYGWPEVVDLLVEARATKSKHGVLAFRRLARAIVRPFASRDAADVKRDAEAEKQRRKRLRRRQRVKPE